MPYSYFKLSSQSGYGAGNHAPAYFELLWEALSEDGIGDLSLRYLSLVARHLREAGTHRSTAEVIDGVRLAQTLSALKDGLAPTLADLRDAAVTLLGQGELSPSRMRWPASMSARPSASLPQGVSQTSIQADFDRELIRLKLEKYQNDGEAGTDLDLRENRQAKTRGGGVPRPAPLVVLPSAARAGNRLRAAGGIAATVDDLGREVAAAVDAGKRDRAGRSGAARRDDRAGGRVQVQIATGEVRRRSPRRPRWFATPASAA